MSCTDTDTLLLANYLPTHGTRMHTFLQVYTHDYTGITTHLDIYDILLCFYVTYLGLCI